MCGICGIYNAQSGERVSQESIERMTHLISHRGPDDTGIYLDGKLVARLRNHATKLVHRVVVWSSGPLSSAVHSLSVVNMPSSETSSSVIDAFLSD